MNIAPGQTKEIRLVSSEKEIVADMVKELEAVRETLRQQMAGIENQLFVLGRLRERMEAPPEPPKEAVTEPEASSEPQAPPEPPMAPQDPLAVIGLSSGVEELETEPEPVGEAKWEDTTAYEAFTRENPLP